MTEQQEDLMDETDENEAVVAESGHSSRTTRTVVVIAAVLATLLLGAAIGMLVKVPGSDSGKLSVPASGSVDVGFAQDMSVHHLQGVQMANIARDRSTDPAIRQLAFDISSGQQEQVGRMKGWLMMWNEYEQSPNGVYMAWMNNSGMAGHGAMTPQPGQALMPGMATSEEMTKLRTMPGGPAFDVYFLQLMLRHHTGGMPMADYAMQKADQPAVRTLANNILKAQTNEIEIMKDYLAKRGAAPLP